MIKKALWQLLKLEGQVIALSSKPSYCPPQSGGSMLLWGQGRGELHTELSSPSSSLELHPLLSGPNHIELILPEAFCSQFRKVVTLTLHGGTNSCFKDES